MTENGGSQALRTLAHSGNFSASPTPHKATSMSPTKQAPDRLRRPRQHTANATTALPPLLPRVLAGYDDDDSMD
jgi:hypothetical protein